MICGISATLIFVCLPLKIELLPTSRRIKASSIAERLSFAVVYDIKKVASKSYLLKAVRDG